MSQISAEVVDTERNAPADRVPIVLEAQSAEGAWEFRTRAMTDPEGRVENLLPEGLALAPGTYRIIFDTGSYFVHHDEETFYPSVIVTFLVTDSSDHIHIPLRLSPTGYETYRSNR